jgi:hypothetical protein
MRNAQVIEMLLQRKSVPLGCGQSKKGKASVRWGEGT